MTEEKLYEVIGDISDKHITEAKQEKKAKAPILLKWGAFAACLCIIAVLGYKTLVPEQEVDVVDTNTLAEEGDVTTTFDTAIEEAAFNRSDESFPNWGLTLSVENVTSTGLTLVVTQSGGEPAGTLKTGTPYRLVKLVDGIWTPVEELPLPEGVDGRGWNDLAYLIPMGESTEFEINWNWIFGELPTGNYRLKKEFMDFRRTADYDTFEYWVEFEIK